jgi:hypothetical protein
MGRVCLVQVYLNGVDVSRSSAYYMSSPTVVISITTQVSASTMGLSKVHLFGKEFFNGDLPGCCFGSTLVLAEWVLATVASDTSSG